MGTTTTTFALNKPTVGGDDNAWGTDLNANADKLDDLLDGTTGITPNLLTGWEVGGVAVTATAAELNILNGVTASAAEINILDGVTASTAELNILDGVTASTAELNYVDGVTSAIQTQLDGKYDSGDLALQAEAEAGTDNTKLMTPLRVAQAARPVLGTSVASTSGTSIDFTGIPAWARRITVMFGGVSTNGTSLKQVQLGSGSFTTSGYSGGGGAISSGSAGGSSSTTGLLVGVFTLASDAFSGNMIITNLTGNSWAASFSGGSATGNLGSVSGGSVTIGGVLDRIRITTVNGTDTFDAGTINIMWE